MTPAQQLALLIRQLKALERWNATACDNGTVDHLTFGPDPQGPYVLVDDVTRIIRDTEEAMC